VSSLLLSLRSVAAALLLRFELQLTSTKVADLLSSGDARIDEVFINLA